ncbi:hypothetical protein DS906_03495 [Ruegeria sp. A3M17]|nr:hypothetical protein DS906_03495 [Ruegeria sp. A3M17]
MLTSIQVVVLCMPITRAEQSGWLGGHQIIQIWVKTGLAWSLERLRTRSPVKGDWKKTRPELDLGG